MLAMSADVVERTLVGHKKRRKGKLLVGAIAIALIAAIVLWRVSASGASGPRYKTARCERGSLAVTVSATGRIEAIETVDVGADVSGRILTVHVDVNDRVKRGQLLAEIDTERLEARLDEGSAELGVAHAETGRALVERDKAERDLERTKVLHEQGLASRQALDDAKAEVARARAGLGAAQARARVAGASLKAAGADVGRARIVAPIDGVVLARNVESGQTLASAFQVPVLFKLARDLRRMKLLVAVDEADVGRVVRKQRASFTVEAYPGRSFRSRVLTVHNMPTIDQGVVSYQAVLEVDTRDLSLRPGMTATATIVTEELADVLLVPNAAVRFVPPEEAEKMRKRDDEPERAESRVWILREGKPAPITLTLGQSDGKQSQVKSGDVEPGMELLVDMEEEP